MPVSIKGTGGGSVTLSAAAAATDTTITLPNTTGTLIYSDASGNVGIGGTPGYLLDVQSASTSATYYAERLYSASNPSGVSATYLRLEKGTGYGGAIGGYISQGVGSGLVLATANGGTFTDQMWITSAGDVGIGTASPGTQFNVYKGTATQVAIRSQNSLAYADFGPISDGTVYGPYAAPAASTGLIVGTSNSNPVQLWTNGAERMRIDTSGNMGIGTSSPNASSILDAQSTTKGVRFPNMTTTQKNAVSSPAAGLVVFDTTLAKLCVYSGSAWQTITSV